jgi:hypothetical protein
MANYEEARNFHYKSNAKDIISKIRDIWEVANILQPQTPLHAHEILLDKTLTHYLWFHSIYKQRSERTK